MSNKGKTEVRLRPGPGDSVIIEKKPWHGLWWEPHGNAACAVHKAIEELNAHARQGEKLLANLQIAEENYSATKAYLKKYKFTREGVTEPYEEDNEFHESVEGSLTVPEPTYKAFINPAILRKYGQKVSSGNKLTGPEKPTDSSGKRVVMVPKGKENDVNPQEFGADSVEGYEKPKPENNRDKNRNNQGNQGKRNRGNNQRNQDG